jgi:CheY-like chemotaxis protein
MPSRVVVVDDDASSASVVAKLLRHLDCEVTACIDPECAVTLALSEEIDLVSLDITMPGLDGYQVLALIRSHEHSRRLPSVPVIAVTGRVSADDQADALAGGFAAHLGKPVMLDSLRRALARALTLRSEMHRTRYSADGASIIANLRELAGRSRDGNLRTAAGMALALEQQGRDVLGQSLRLAFSGQPEAACRPVVEFARLVHAFGAQRLATCLEELADHLESGGELLETAAVLARAELDRVIFTLREQVLH